MKTVKIHEKGKDAMDTIFENEQLNVDDAGSYIIQIFRLHLYKVNK